MYYYKMWAFCHDLMLLNLFLPDWLPTFSKHCQQTKPGNYHLTADVIIIHI